ncbi:hypothetical protein QFZ30_002112 [Arthrobacter pascens]|nr:hypothetical protein [Arthrobacter pascens]
MLRSRSVVGPSRTSAEAHRAHRCLVHGTSRMRSARACSQMPLTISVRGRVSFEREAKRRTDVFVTRDDCGAAVIENTYCQWVRNRVGGTRIMQTWMCSAVRAIGVEPVLRPHGPTDCQRVLDRDRVALRRRLAHPRAFPQDTCAAGELVAVKLGTGETINRTLICDRHLQRYGGPLATKATATPASRILLPLVSWK